MAAVVPEEEDPRIPLPGFNFHVEARVPAVEKGKLLCLGAFAEVSGLEATMEPKVIKAGGRNYGAIQRAGPVSFATVVLKRGVSEARDLWAWWALVSGGDGAVTSDSAAKRTTVIVSMMRDGKNGREAVLSWKLENAMPVKFKAGDLNARATEVAIEELHLVQGLEHGGGMTTAMIKAKFSTPGGPELEVDFNPASLKLTITNTMQDDEPNGNKGDKQAKSKGTPPRQNVRKSATKLETELVFDTTEPNAPEAKPTNGTATKPNATDSSRDVRVRTNKLKLMARPKTLEHPAIPRVTFEWGLFKFVGFIESITETLDFWSGEGVPLRSTVQLVMQSLELDVISADKPKDKPKATTHVPPGARGTTDAATQAGDPRAGPALAAANGLESMRMPTGGELAVTGGVELKEEAAFSAGAAAGIGLSAGAGAAAGIGGGFGADLSGGAGFAAGASAGFGASASASFGASASASFGATASASVGARAGVSTSVGFGASASAGVSAVAGAFDGLGVSKRVTTILRIDPERLLPLPGTRVIGSGASFDVTGRVIAGGSAGLSANVRGAAGARVRFI